jgi:hypothetical protein
MEEGIEKKSEEAHVSREKCERRDRAIETPTILNGGKAAREASITGKPRRSSSRSRIGGVLSTSDAASVLV